jgi:hypothetical protein
VPVVSDLCGPLSSPSFSGCKYFLTFIDDFSRRTWVWGHGCFPVGVLPRQNIGVLIFDLVV